MKGSSSLNYSCYYPSMGGSLATIIRPSILGTGNAQSSRKLIKIFLHLAKFCHCTIKDGDVVKATLCYAPIFDTAMMFSSLKGTVSNNLII